MKFEEIERAKALVNHNGTFSNVPIFKLQGLYYLKYKSGYHRINLGFTTTNPDLLWETLLIPSPNSVCVDPWNRVCDHWAPGAKALSTAERTKHKIQ